MTDGTQESAVGRRQFAKLSAATLGLSAFGSSVVAAESTERFIVKRNGKQSLDAEVLYDLPEIGYAVVRGSESELEQSTAVQSFAPDIELEFSEPVDRAEYEGDANDDELYPLQWDKQDLDISTAHETTKGEGTRVAIIDSGVDAGHPDLKVNTDLSRNFTGDDLPAGVPGGGYHGTHVAGIVGAETAGSEGVAGTAPGTELVDFRVFSDFGGTNGAFSILVAAIMEAVRTDCDVANLSIGAYPISRQGLGSFYGGFINKATTYARKEGTLLVVSAGNDGADLQHDSGLISLPNEAAGVMSIAATGPLGFVPGRGADAPPETPASYTNYGTNAIDLAAPGGNLGEGSSTADYVLSTGSFFVNAGGDLLPVDEDGDGEDDPANKSDIAGIYRAYFYALGTSMAAPNVAGAAALVKSANPGYSANQLRSALEGAAELPEGEEKAYYGSGYLNVVDAL
ncbi:S8 family serine peptidase [Halolamina salifodinae]|uniref:Subtilisin family serine protease n=1 Tax=Halolamina salifodinae TaxID=1202767 RepID=A0A8T4GY13_9EURY|nr:S8 family serine peptidase [Halolamina salifodinae]MBP1987013.1 subtilisin family serine protease [Halolamina salifodinae]